MTRELKAQVQQVLEELERLADKKTLDGLPRYGIVVKKAYGVPMAALQKLAKRIGKNHELALALWDTGWYDARLLAAYVDEPENVTAAQMDKWRRDFDNWGICDTVCFVLFDRTKHAFRKVEQWARLKDEYGKRAAFALLACLALHDKKAGNEAFLRCLPLIAEARGDKRNFVKKGVDWAVRAMERRNPELKAAVRHIIDSIHREKH